MTRIQSSLACNILGEAIEAKSNFLINFLIESPLFKEFNLLSKLKPSPSHFAIKRGYLDKNYFERISETYPDFDERDAQGNTPLHFLMKKNSRKPILREIIKFILQSGYYYCYR